MAHRLFYSYQVRGDPPIRTYEEIESDDEMERRLAELEHAAGVLSGSVRVEYWPFTEKEIVLLKKALEIALADLDSRLSDAERSRLQFLIDKM